MFSGQDLERWALKLLTGLLVSGNATLDGQKTVVNPVPTWWLEALIGRVHLPSGIGLGTMEVVGTAPKNLQDSIAFAPIFYRDAAVDVPVGATMWMRGLALGLMLANIPNKVGTWAEHFLHHASITKFVGPGTSVTLLLAGEGWDKACGTTIHWTADPSA
jgi:hypothetical protein